MRRFSLKSVLAIGTALIGAGVLPSCATNDSMMFIIGVYARKSGSCTPKPEEESPLFDRGVLDRAFAKEYRAALLVGNQVTQRGSREQIRTETSRISLKGAEVQLETLQGASLADAFTSTATGFVDASTGTDASLAIMYASLIPASVAGSLPEGTLLAKVRVFGDTLGGQEVESSELAFPIEVCTGCLVTYPADARDLTADGTDYQCKVASDDTDSDSASTDVDLPCNLGIDLPVPCTTCSSLFDECLRPDLNPYYDQDP